MNSIRGAQKYGNTVVHMKYYKLKGDKQQIAKVRKEKKGHRNENDF